MGVGVSSGGGRVMMIMGGFALAAADVFILENWLRLRVMVLACV